MAKKKLPQETYMAIQLSSSHQDNIPTKRYIRWIDEHWYETIDYPNVDIPESKIEEVKKWLKKHFIYYATFLRSDGTQEKWCAFTNRKKRSVTMTLGDSSTIKFIL